MTLQPYALAEGEHLKADKLALLEARRVMAKCKCNRAEK